MIPRSSGPLCRTPPARTGRESSFPPAAGRRPPRRQAGRPRAAPALRPEHRQQLPRSARRLRVPRRDWRGNRPTVPGFLRLLQTLERITLPPRWSHRFRRSRSVIPEQAAAAEPDTSPAGPSQALPSGTAPAPGGLPPVEEPGAGGAPATPSVETAPAPPAASSDLRPRQAPAAGTGAGDPLLGPNPELMPALDAPAASPGKGRAET